ncbi:hypothetical protein HanRHA438_Chr03g0102591 [Helianthus annuus]|nr:hypothetical protein HanRHA438_Chr03g0102591 [Helianthus annuus]
MNFFLKIFLNHFFFLKICNNAMMIVENFRKMFSWNYAFGLHRLFEEWLDQFITSS